MSRLLPGLLALIVLYPSLLAADTKPMERKTDDRQIIDLLAAVHDRGATLFNSGDHAGSYRLFQGSLMTIRLVLPKEVQELVDRGFARADLEPNYLRRAMVLHQVIEDVRKKLHATAGSVEKLGQPRKADPKAVTDGLRAPETPKPSNAAETNEPPKAPAVAPKPKTEPSSPPPPILQTIPTSNPKKPMPPPEAPAPGAGLTVPPRPSTPAGPSNPTLPPAPLPGQVTPASGAPELIPPPLPMPPKKENSSAPPPLVAPGK